MAEKQDEEGGGLDIPYSVSIPAGTIVINTDAVHKDCCQLEIYHECIHYDWHYRRTHLYQRQQICLPHSDFSTTANIYAHLDAQSKSSTADAMLRGLGFTSPEDSSP